MSVKRKLEETDVQTDPEIYTSEPITDRSSKFIAIYTPNTSISSKTIQRHPPFQTASHRVTAYRHPSAQTTLSTSSRLPGKPIYKTGFDDDGESWAGKHVLKVLQSEDVVGCIVVARWYGGVMLGKVRFEHIENVAREAVREWKKADGGGEKKVKIDGGEKQGLVEELQKRDQSVSVLRGLLAEKMGQTSSQGSQKVSVAVIDYDSMDVDQLKKLERARDSTISWLLNKIEQIEHKEKIGSTATEISLVEDNTKHKVVDRDSKRAKSLDITDQKEELQPD